MFPIPPGMFLKLFCFLNLLLFTLSSSNKNYIFINLGIINKLFSFVFSHYKVNDLVKIKLKALETTGHFLGLNRRVTLCEADANLEGKLNPDTTYRVLERD